MSQLEAIARIIAYEYDMTEDTWESWVSLAERIITMTRPT